MPRYSQRSLTIVDLPGHERLRYKFFDKYKNSAIGLVYVIDSTTLARDVRDAAEWVSWKRQNHGNWSEKQRDNFNGKNFYRFLYTLLSDKTIQKNIEILILCNKQDQTLAKTCEAIRTLLEKEINLLRFTKSNQLEGTDATSANSFIGKQDQTFEFSHLVNKVDFAENSISDTVQFESWLKKVVWDFWSFAIAKMMFNSNEKKKHDQ